MDQAKVYLKILAVVSASALVGALVAYRAGAFASPAPPEPPEQQPVAGEQPVPESTPGTDPKSPAIMYGSKSAPAFTHVESGTTPAPTPQTQPQPQPNPVYLGGSKSKFIFEPPKSNPGPQAGPVVPPQP